MNYILMPSLQHMALVKIVATLWNQEHVKALTVARFNEFEIRNTKWQEIEETVLEKVPQLLLPRRTEDKVLSSVKPIGMQILRWMLCYFKNTHLWVGLPVEFCWTPQGTIDRQRTAQMFVKDENLDISKRYEWACVYCLEDDISKLWMKMPNNYKQSLMNRYSVIMLDWPDLVCFWTWNMQGKEDDVDFSCQYLFHFSAIHGNKAATEYLLKKLTPAEKEHCMVDTAGSVDDPDVLSFLLSEMDEEEQVEFFKSARYRGLECFLNWPLQCFFIETVTRAWDFLDYSSLLSSILEKRLNGFKDWNYSKLWGDVWEKGSVTLKRDVLNEFHCETLKQLLRVKDKENCRLMLKDATAIEKKKLIHCDSVQSACLNIIRDFEWDPLEFFIQEFLSSKDEMLQFKEELEKRMMSGHLFKDILGKNKRKWNELFCFSYNSLSKDDKRTAEDGQCSSSKRFRSLQ